MSAYDAGSVRSALTAALLRAR